MILKKSRYIFIVWIEIIILMKAFRLEYGYDSSTGHDEIDAKTVDRKLCTRNIKFQFSSKPTSIANHPNQFAEAVQQILQAIQLTSRSPVFRATYEKQPKL